MTPAEPCGRFPDLPGTDPDTRCGEPSIGLYAVGCITEHITVVRICAGCAVDVQQAAGKWLCRHCGRKPRIVITWDDRPSLPLVVQEADVR